MTKEEILEYFKDINHAYNDCTRYDTLKRMIDELQEPCDDAISRQAVLDIVNNPLNIRLDKIIEKLPPVNPQPKTGHWIKIKPYPLQMHDYECSECLHETDDPTENYCSECGAKMVEPQESEVENERYTLS